MIFSLILLNILGATQGRAADRMSLIVNLFNQVVKSCLTFNYDFGSGVDLLHGNATVMIFPPIYLQPHSELSKINNTGTFVLRSPDGFRIFRQDNKEELNLVDCYIDLQYSVERRNNIINTRSDSVWLESCAQIGYHNYKRPKHANQILPVLSQAIFNELSKHFTFFQYPHKVNLNTLKKLFGWIIQSGIKDKHIRRECTIKK